MSRCDAWFARLADGKHVRCSLPPGHACAHAWADVDVEAELVRVAFEAGRRAEREDVVAWLRSAEYHYAPERVESGEHVGASR